MNYHVITPLNRFENVGRLIELLEPQRITWHVIQDAERPYYIQFPQGWIRSSILVNEPGTFYERCNRSINKWMDHHRWVDEDRYCILNDDDAYEPGFFDKLRAFDEEVLAVSMMRGHHIPAGVSGERAHGTDTLVADPSNMKVGRIGVEQMIVSGRILRTCRLPLTIAGDGEMLTYIGATNPVKYVPDANVWFNYLEPGRWNQ